MIALIRFLLAILTSPFKSKSRLEAENVALRQQLVVLQRKVKSRVALSNGDRLFFVQLYQWFPSILEIITIIQPETLVRWHRAGFRRYWRWKSRRRGERPQIYTELRALIVRLDRRTLVWANGARHPTAQWIARQITGAFPWDEARRYLIRDRDGVFGAVVTRRLRAMGIRDKPIAPASPWQNAFAERLIGSIRRECVDHLIVFGERHLRRILRCYAHYYNEVRTHRSLKLNKDTPISRAVQRIGAIKSHALLGGLHHHYVRI
ncbi:integrase core domain-containing protein [Methylocystis sp.]|uniref:integrase core domain-containing protein n=1 Tax=Methylocystis sp. TaxID=1911079 RepID=UPI0025E5775C|nr:integrase core domain-containing protein [Methylocystis sp.]